MDILFYRNIMVGIKQISIILFVVVLFLFSCDDGGGSDSKDVIVPPPAGEDNEAPSIPSGLTVTAVSSNQINLAWNASTDNVGVAGYKIYRGGQFLLTSLETSYSDTGCSNGTQYCYRVSAHDAKGNESGLSASVCDTTDSSAKPSAPTNLNATPLSSSTIRLAWTDNADNEEGFRIHIFSGSIVGWDKYVSVNTTQYDCIDLTPSWTYYFSVFAYNSEGESDGTFASATTQAQPSSTSIFNPNRDNAVLYNSLNANVAKTSFPIDYLAAGFDFLYNALYGYDTFAAASLVYFDVGSTISGKTIVRATLRLYPYELPGDWDTVYRVYALYSSWNTSVTWNSCPDWYNSPYAEQNPPATTSLPVEWDVTQIVQRWADGTWNNYGFVVWDPNTVPQYTPALRMSSFESMNRYTSTNRRPELEIEYK